MLKKISENEEIPSRYGDGAMIMVWTSGIWELPTLSSVDLISAIDKCHLILRVSSINAIVENGHDGNWTASVELTRHVTW